MRIAVADLRPNPFRNLEHYPVDQTKVDALVQSIKETDFWDNIVARRDSNGGYELAYGVHRLAALKKARIEEVDIPVRRLSNDIMMKMMVHENQTEWSSNALVDQESIRAVVSAFGADQIELPSVAHRDSRARNSMRYAPSFTPGHLLSERSESKAYSATTLCKFLGGEKAGWPESKVEAILATLAAEEEGLIERESLEGLSTHQAAQVARQARRVVRETGGDQNLARNIGRRLASGMRTATGRSPGRGAPPSGQRQAITYHGAARAADEMMGRDRRANRPARAIPNVEDFISSQVTVVNTIAAADEKLAERLERLIAVREELPRSDKRGLINALRAASKRLTKLADRLDA